MKTEKRNLSTLVMSRLAGLLVVAALVAVAFPGIASAHARLTASTPADGATVPVGLTQVAMTFAEETSVDQSNAQLLDTKSQAVAGATYAVNRADRTKMTLTTPPLQAGVYTVKYKTVTEDDNGIVNGSFSFTVASNTAGSSAPGTPTVMSAMSTPMAMPQSTATTAAMSNTNSTPQSPLPTTGAGDATGLWATLLLASAAILTSAGIAVRKRSRL